MVLAPIGIFLVAGAAVWWAGTGLSREVDALANSSVPGRVFIGALLHGAGGVDACGDTFVGAALVAITTSLPEVSTVFGTLRTRSYGMAEANIAATNALEVALLAVADGACREGAYRMERSSTTSGVPASSSPPWRPCSPAFQTGLVLRGNRTALRMGYDSAAVVLVYAGGLAVSPPWAGGLASGRARFRASGK